MLYLVHMRVDLPPTLDAERADELKRTEKERALELQRDGRWVHLWRVAGRYENYSVFDVADHDELHGLLMSLPLFPYLDISVTALAQHPSALTAQPDRHPGQGSRAT
ncbi:muconolactone Delta-isomerase [Blastococcus sp. SYSU DS0539]